MSWENDERGKPCKWLKTVVIDDEDRCHRNAEYDKKIAEIDEAFKQCSAAVQELTATGEYVVRVAPEIVETRDLEAMQYRYFIRARVRWVTPEAKANMERNINAMFDAAEDEFQQILTERAGGKPN